MNPGIAEHPTRRPCVPRMICLLYGAGRVLSCRTRERSPRYRTR